MMNRLRCLFGRHVPHDLMIPDVQIGYAMFYEVRTFCAHCGKRIY